MFMRAVTAVSLLLYACMLISCASHSPSEAVYHDSAFNDHNRAPASVSPPQYVADGVGNIDPLYLRTQADYHFSLGEAYSFEGQNEKAIEAFKMVLIFDPETAVVHLKLAAQYVKMGLMSEALEQAEEAVRRDPKLVDGKMLLGGIYSALKFYDKALKSYQEVLAVDPGNMEAPLYIGALYAEKKQHDKAVKFFEDLAKNEEYSNPHLAYYYVGKVRVDQGTKASFKQAEAAFRKSLELRPDYADATLALGVVYAKLGEEKKALETYRKFQIEQGPNLKIAELLSQKYIELEMYDLAFEQLEILERQSDDDSLNVKVRMALVLIEQKNYEGAVLKLHEVLKLAPDSDKIRFYLAAVYEEMGRASEAIDHFTKVPSASQFYGEAMVHATYLLKQSKRIDEALKWISEAIEMRDDVPQFYAVHASLLDEKGQFNEAVKLLEKGAQKFPDYVQIRFFLGTVNDRLGRKDQVELHMKKVIDMDPNHIQGLNYLAFTWAEANKNLDEAEKLVRRALEIEPRDGYILDTLGWILYKKGNPKEAVKVLEAAFKQQPTEAIIAEHLGDAYHKLQMSQKAKSMYERAVQNETDEGKVQQIRAKITAISEQDIHVTHSRAPSSEEGK